VREQESRFDITVNLNRYLATLSKVYEQEATQRLRPLIVNAKATLEEEVSYDNWNGGTYGHILHLILPTELFSFPSLRNKETFENRICSDLNKIKNATNEFFQKVSFEVEVLEDTDWREESGLLIGAKKQVPEKTLSHIWGDKEYFRLFVSHKAEVKAQVATLKTGLGKFGVSCFVAHVDIHPTKEWQDEIENALESMDGFVALLTPDYHDSSWTDQEVGFALARRVPIIAVRMGKVPYGFIGKFQAL
jgi:TIR domain